MTDGRRLAKGPEIFSRSWIHGDHLAARGGYRIKHAVDVDRGGAGKVVQIRAEVIATPGPHLLQIPEVTGVDLIQGRVAGMTSIAAQVAPLTVLGARQALGMRGRGRHQHYQSDKIEYESLYSEISALNFHHPYSSTG